MKRKIVCIIALLVLAALAAGCLAACNTDDELPSGTPVSWETYLEQAAQAVVDRVVAEAGDYRIDINIDYNGMGVELDRVTITIAPSEEA